MPRRRIVRYGALIQAMDTGRYCLVKQVTSGYLGFPKGHRKRKESVIKCVRREAKEETGIDLSNYHFEPPLMNREFQLYSVGIDRECEAKPVDTREIAYCMWLTYDELVALASTEKISNLTATFIRKFALIHIQKHIQQDEQQQDKTNIAKPEINTRQCIS